MHTPAVRRVQSSSPKATGIAEVKTFILSTSPSQRPLPLSPASPGVGCDFFFFLFFFFCHSMWQLNVGSQLPDQGLNSSCSKVPTPNHQTTNKLPINWWYLTSERGDYYSGEYLSKTERLIVMIELSELQRRKYPFLNTTVESVLWIVTKKVVFKIVFCQAVSQCKNQMTKIGFCLLVQISVNTSLPLFL